MNVGYLIFVQCSNLLGLYISDLFRYKSQAGEFVAFEEGITACPIYWP